MENEKIVLYVSPKFAEFLRTHTPNGTHFGDYWGKHLEDELYTWREEMFKELEKGQTT